MSKTEEIQEDKNEGGFPVSNIKSINLVLDSVMAKGGHASREVLKTTFGKGATLFQWALSSATELGLIDYAGKEYSLSALGNRFCAESKEGQKRMMRSIVLNYPPYRTLLLRLRNAPDGSLSKTDVTKAWYELTKKGGESVRQLYTKCFASLCEWCGLIENRQKTIVLTEEGKTFISGTQSPKTDIATSPKTNLETENNKAEGRPNNTSVPQTQAQITTAITINITVETKDQTSVENLLKIIKAIKGNDGSQTI